MKNKSNILILLFLSFILSANSQGNSFKLLVRTDYTRFGSLRLYNITEDKSYFPKMKNNYSLFEDAFVEECVMNIYHDSSLLGSIWISSGTTEISIKHSKNFTDPLIEIIEGSKNTYLVNDIKNFSKEIYNVPKYLLIKDTSKARLAKQQNQSLIVYTSSIDVKKATDSILEVNTTKLLDSLFITSADLKSLPVVLKYFAQKLSVSKVAEYYSKLSEAQKKVREADILLNYLKQGQSLNDSLKNILISDFILVNNIGKKTNIKQALGKQYTLISFWASWCGPCREKNKYIRELYNRFNNKGFEVISISLDTDKENWIKAQKNDKISWVDLSDLKGFQGELVKKLNIYVLPVTVILNSDGKIIFENLTNQEIQSTVESLMTNNYR